MNAAQVLPLQDDYYQFNAAASYDPPGPPKCWKCGLFGDKQQYCTTPPPEQGQGQGQGQGQWQGQGRGRGATAPRGRGQSIAVSNCSSLFGTNVCNAWLSSSGNVEQTDKVDNEPDVAEPVAEKTHGPGCGPTGNAEPKYFVNALSTNGLRMMFDGCLAAPSRPPL